MMEQEAKSCGPGEPVEYQGQRATVVIMFLRGKDFGGFHARFHVKTEHGADYHDVDYPDLTLISEA
jgi:hypothetical protein